MAAPLVSPTIVAHPAGYELPSGYLETPTDELTGLPWCIAPQHDRQASPPLPPGTNTSADRPGDWNHQYPQVEVWYSGNPVLQDDIAKAALVNLRLQWVDYRAHHELYNNNFIGPRQPATKAQLAATLIMGIAGYVPDGGIDLSGNTPKFRQLQTYERQWLWSGGYLRTACAGDVQRYLFQYVFSQDYDHLRLQELDEFFHTVNFERRLHLAHVLSAKMVERAVEPVEPVYRLAHEQGKLLQAVPANPRDLVKNTIVRNKIGRIDNALRHLLGIQHRGLEEHPAAA